MYAVCSEMLACKEEGGLSQKTCLFCCSDSVSLEDLHGQEEADPSETSGHYPPGTLQGTAGEEEIRCPTGEGKRRVGEKEKGRGDFEKEERTRET